MRFSAVEELAVDRIAFSWRARFPLAIRVFDGYSGGRGKLEARILGVPVMRQSGAEVAAGEVLRYLAELPWVPWATEHNAELECQELDARSVEVAARGGGRRLAVTLEFDAAGDIVRAGCHARPWQVGRTSVLTPWGGEFGDYRTLGGMRIPTCGQGLLGARPGPIRLLERRGDLGRGARPAVRCLISEWRDRHRPGGPSLLRVHGTGRP